MMYFKTSRPLVAVDKTLVGGVEVLRANPLDSVARIEFVSPWRAAKRYGTGFGNGIMLVETRVDSPPKLADR